MIRGIGVDVCGIDRFAAMLQRRPGIVERLFTASERERDLDSLAARFAAKEAIAKALGSPGGMTWIDCEIASESNGRPVVRASGTVRQKLAEFGVDQVHLTLSHDAGIATAFVVLEGADHVAGA